MSQQLLATFQALQKQDELEFTVGRVFHDFVPVLKFYTAYATSYRSAITKHHELVSSSQQYALFCASCASHADCSRGDLASYMILGVQRVPRYKLLLEGLLKTYEKEQEIKQSIAASKEGSESTELLGYVEQMKQALQEVSTIANVINAGVDDYERREKVLAVQNQFSGPGTDELVKPHRFVVSDTTFLSKMKSKAGKFTKTYKPTRFVLFNDLLLYGLKTGRTVRHPTTSAPIEVYKCLAVNKLQNTSFFPLPNSNEFAIMHAASSTTVRVKSMSSVESLAKQERDLWLKNITKYRNDTFSSIDTLVSVSTLSGGNSPTKPKLTSPSKSFKLAESPAVDRVRQSPLSQGKSKSFSVTSSGGSPVTMSPVAKSPSGSLGASPDSACFNCKGRFGLLSKRVVCYQCHHLVCQICSQNKWRFNSNQTQTQTKKVCVACYRRMYFGLYGFIPNDPSSSFSTSKLSQVNPSPNSAETVAEPKIVKRKGSSSRLHRLQANRFSSDFSIFSTSQSQSSKLVAEDTGFITEIILPPDWKEVKLPTGEKYYVNEKTQAVRWTRPSNKPSTGDT